MPKYKISKSNLKEFFGFFGKKRKPRDIKKLIDNDPQLKKIDKELEDIYKKYRNKPTNPYVDDLMKKYGI